ncbi:hypothetical protein JB92DRAFT_2981465 [Gautieria morchelliformis]|nr:hypothetical protein JB92DRAFT_2981465 [Gautieria morchelliformis]
MAPSDELCSESCRESQEQEWLALQSTYPDFLPSERPEYGEQFVLQVAVQLPEPTPVHIVEHNSANIVYTVSVSHLPPLLLKLLLPPTYPLEQPPIIHSLESLHDWLSADTLKILENRLFALWDKENVLGIWMDHIRNGELLSFLYSSPTSINLASSTPRVLWLTLAAHNASVLDAHFRAATHSCPICLNRLPGTRCISLSPCSHVACRDCLGSFWGHCIKEGDVARVGCPDPNCVKEDRQASTEDVKAVVSAEEVVRWQLLLRKREVEQDPTIIHCPVVSCQQPVLPPSPAEDGRPSEWDRLRLCECGFAFCMYCRRAWHGPHTSCSLLTTAEFVQMYLQYPEGSTERSTIEKRHGKANVLKLVAKFREEQLNRTWMEKETMTCPGCQVHVQKNAGCNHMTCSKCRQHFCYRCGAKLEPSNPYRHFNTPGQPCYSKLFDQHDQEEDRWIAWEDLDT